MSRIINATPGMKGFDANTTVSYADAQAFKRAGYGFAVRYVRRAAAHDFDISVREVRDITGAGLGLMLVQHVAAEGWIPTKLSGSRYGFIAAQEASRVAPPGLVVWCDLEGVSLQATTTQVDEYCRAWYKQVALAGFIPGIYVGWHPGLGPQQLYQLPFQHYWRAYNGDVIVPVRGFQMLQHEYPGHLAVPGIPFEYDTDLVRLDSQGGLPNMLVNG